jgi:hypothetical protein
MDHLVKELQNYFSALGFDAETGHTEIFKSFSYCVERLLLRLITDKMSLLETGNVSLTSTSNLSTCSNYWVYRLAVKRFGKSQCTFRMDIRPTSVQCDYLPVNELPRNRANRELAITQHDLAFRRDIELLSIYKILPDIIQYFDRLLTIDSIEDSWDSTDKSLALGWSLTIGS